MPEDKPSKRELIEGLNKIFAEQGEYEGELVLQEYIDNKLITRKLWDAHVKTIKKDVAVYQGSVTQFYKQPKELNCGKWVANESDGIFCIKGWEKCQACWHPIMPLELLTNIDTRTEKVKIAFKKGNTEWREEIIDRDFIASNSKIVQLSNVGIAVTSDTAKHLVAYFDDIERLNTCEIEHKKSIGRLGWINNHTDFSPYSKDLTFDGDVNYKSLYEAVKPQGNYDIWLDLCRTARARKNIPSNLILASSFASVLLSPLNKLMFLVHLWGGTEVGKTVGLMYATSVWANPQSGKYMQTYNSTDVGKELYASFTNNLPLVLNEFQVERNSDASKFEATIYKLCEGTGKLRATKSVGVRETPVWRNVILSSGETPLGHTNSGAGFINRIIDIECTGNLFDDAPHVADIVQVNYGHAGKVWVEFVKNNLESITATYKQIYNDIEKCDTTAKQAMAMAVILTADKFATDLIFQDGNELKITDVLKYLATKDEVNINLRAYKFISQYVAMNAFKFSGKSDTDKECWGAIEGDYVYFVRNKLVELLNDNKYSIKPLLTYLSNNELLLGSFSKGKKDDTVVKKINGIPIRCYKIKISQEQADFEEESISQDLPF